MLYLIPAWYKLNTWSESEQCWYVRREKSEYDDTVKQVQLFHRNRAWAYRIIVLSHVPNFRHFLHRQSIFRARYWSCFDAMCEITKRKMMVFSFKDIKWPEGVEFEYTPFAIVAYLDGVKIAQVELGEDGNMIRIDMFSDGELIRRNIYDDRGFVSCSEVYRDGSLYYTDYLMDSGIWKLRQFAGDGHVEINPKDPYFLLLYRGKEYRLKYEKLRYDDIEEVISEVFSEYIDLTNDEDIFCIAMHDRHMNVIDDGLVGKKLVLSFFGERIELQGQQLKNMLFRANYIVADSPMLARNIKVFAGSDMENITDISPYDSRTDFGVSQQISVQKILVPVDELEDEVFEKVIQVLGQYLMENDKAQIHLFTREAAYDMKSNLLKKTRKVLRKSGMDDRMAADESIDASAENEIDSLDMVPVRFIVDQCVDELSVSRCIREQRILVDVSEKPEYYVQIAAISTGIPQIVMTENQYVENGENGRVIKRYDDITKALRFYLDSLANWNEAMICSYEMGKRFSTGILLDKWKEVIKGVG